MPTREQTIRGVYRDMFETGDVSKADLIVTADFVDHAAPPGPAARGPQQLAAVIGYLHGALADIGYTVEDLISEGDRFAYRSTLSATQVGTLFGFPPTGLRFTMQQLHMVRFDGDRIAEHWACRDDFGALRQLGHLS
ncbi:ester cyclase [Dactylosporangium sp. NPDC048998]|uniref:ester cyclase n=1 Tax=Dactylosporangium sp. NPDC048998 TaxID=3363976 RepID=UPI0037150C4A